MVVFLSCLMIVSVVLRITPIQSICDYPYNIRGSVQCTKTSGNTLHGCEIFVLILQTDGSVEWLAFLLHIWKVLVCSEHRVGYSNQGF